MTDLEKTRIPLVLKTQDWPSRDQDIWTRLFANGGLFDDVGAFSRWSDGSRLKREQSYGQWLSFLLRTSPETLKLAPSARVSPGKAKAYLIECEERLAPKSILNLMSDLFVIAREMDGSNDWAWLDRLVKRLKVMAETHSLRSRAPITAQDIFDWSLKRTAEVRVETDCSPLKRAIWHRQALMIGFLISRPVRRRALLSMNVDSHIQGDTEGYQLTFPAEDMKDQRRRDFPLPEQLTQVMTEYLELHREVLLGGRHCKGLWINQYGAQITPDGFSRDLPNITKRHLGIALRPHRFRDIAATSIAETDPRNVGIIRDILGHATMHMADKHYNRASQVDSFNALQNALFKLQAEYAMKTRKP